jgi:CheY-like chemotaxis protein
MATTTTILVAAGDEATRESIDMIFAQEPGIYYAIAAGGANAIAKLSDGPPDVLLTDLAMPGTDGHAVVAYARKRYPGIPIVVFSTQNLAAPIESDHAVGDQPVLLARKPPDFVPLLKVLRELGADRSWRSAAAEAS